MKYPWKGRSASFGAAMSSMHLHDKPALFSRLFDLTAPGGHLAITDYARGTTAGSPEFQAYVKSTGYHLTDPAELCKLLEGAGYVKVVAEDSANCRFRADILVERRYRLHPKIATTSSNRSRKKT